MVFDQTLKLAQIGFKAQKANHIFLGNERTTCLRNDSLAKFKESLYSLNAIFLVTDRTSNAIIRISDENRT